MNKESSNTAIVIEKDEEIFKMIHSALIQKKYMVERASNFQEAIKRLEEKEYQRVVCAYNLTDKESFDFIGKVKKLPYNHPNLILLTSTLLFDQDKISQFDDLIHSEEMRKELGKIFESSFDEMNISEAFKSGPTYLEFSKKNTLPFEKTYVYDFKADEILLGAWAKAGEQQYGNKLILNASIKGTGHEIILTGKFITAAPFDTNKGDVTYLSFKLDPDGHATWKKYLDVFSEEDIELEELLINMRGF